MRSVFLALFLAFIGVDSLRAEQSSAESRNDRRPNILFAIADDASFPHMSAYGTTWVNTPAFDRVAKTGIRFDRCYTPNAKCAPSRSCVLTGRYSWQLGAAANHWCNFPSELASYVDVLSDAGYATGMTGKGWGPGIAVDAQGNRRDLAGKRFSQAKSKPPTKKINPNDYAENFEQFLASVGRQKPFCFWYGSSEPHRAYEYGSGVAKGGKNIESIEHVPPYWPDNEVVRNDMLDYAFEIEHFDAHLGRMIDTLDRLGELENTLIVVTSDNGMPFPRVKGQSYESSHHLPLAICWPAGIKNPGRVVNELVSFVDIAPTFLDVGKVDWATSALAGDDLPEPVGKSMVDLFDDAPKRDRDFVLIGKERHDVGRPDDVGYPVRGIIWGAFLLVENVEADRWPSGNPETGYLNIDGSPTKTEVLELRRSGVDSSFWKMCFGKRDQVEMFNVLTDAGCTHNLAAIDRYQDAQAEMARLLDTVLKAQNDPRAFGNGAIFDSYPYADEKTKNFYSRYLEDPDSIRAGWVNDTDFEPEPITDGLEAAIEDRPEKDTDSKESVEAATTP